jgi:hypothetical protein
MHLEILGGKCVSSMKKCVFIPLERCFWTVFCEFFEVIFDCTCALADQSQYRYAGIVYEHYCLCPGWPWARKSFKKGSMYMMCRECRAVNSETGHVCNKLYTPPPTIRPIVWAPQDIAIISYTATLCVHIELQCIRAILTTLTHRHLSEKLS